MWGGGRRKRRKGGRGRGYVKRNAVETKKEAGWKRRMGEREMGELGKTGQAEDREMEGGKSRGVGWKIGGKQRRHE